MNKVKKKITVRFFSIEASDSYVDDFISIHHANQANDKKARILNIKGKKHLVKIHDELDFHGTSIFLLSVVRERNTWQARALSNGKISGISLNQGIIGDPYYFAFMPEKMMLLGFTTGLSASIKSVANAVLSQFNKERTSKVTLDYISKDKEFSKLSTMSGYSMLYFKVNPSSIGDINDDTPGLLRELSSAPFMADNSQFALTLTKIGEDGLSEIDLVSIVNHLADNEGCSALVVQGVDQDGIKVHLDFSKAYVLYQTTIELRENYVDEMKAKSILLDAFQHNEKTS